MKNKGENTEICDVRAGLTNTSFGSNQQGLKLNCKMNREPMDSSEDSHAFLFPVIILQLHFGPTASELMC